MAEVKASMSRGEGAAELVREASSRGAEGSTYSESVPTSIAPESPSFFKRLWIRIQILAACSGLRGARGDGLLEPRRGLSRARTSGLASGAQRTQEDSESEVLSRIAASKSTWSEVPGRDIHHSVAVPCPSQLSVWEELKASNPHFFADGIGDELEVGRLIAEGGQAHIFEAKFRGEKEWDMVLKVFKLDAGFSLADLKRQWPRSMRKDDGEGRTKSMPEQERCSMFIFDNAIANIDGGRCLILGATLLRDGRFAFLMHKYWGDLRTLIDQKVRENTHRWKFDFISKNRRGVSPFSFRDSIDIMSEIAEGMQGLHAEGVLHRDLKAANVLIPYSEGGYKYCEVADYECAMFVHGTGFWRAPEVWQELQKREEVRNGEIWTEKVDVYSFGMTCYEILTGQIPFDGYTKNKWDDVISGERPSLPHYVFPKLRELVEACWHTQPSQRPSFEVVIRKLRSLRYDHRVWK